MMAKLGLNLHHVGYAVESIDSIADKYVVRFGYKLSSPVIHDPRQTAFVQFLQLPGDLTYLEFVSPDGPVSKLAGTVRRGGGLNHLCYTCGPLEETVMKLGESGMRLISELLPGVAFAGRRICWLLGDDLLPIELVERATEDDLCVPGVNPADI